MLPHIHIQDCNPSDQPRTDVPHGSDDPASQPIPVYTPAEAAERLAVRESWLRRKASQRAIPCTFLGKHLRFSDKDLHWCLNTFRLLFSMRRAWIWLCRISGTAIFTLSGKRSP
ncbi:helix-turn-helix domain-containing protein [Saccharopolyspora elongata]|uniref:DNA-binding protein n=1 Tax=Saccharopolyspora elongata TaxID=2530387 RepID=A0A4R4Z5D9_9PSEU|nr:helix-turn-helix domain-containing protein [Saccharopolyspora elongata]TDD53381.1 DNA-binding protein [Saccharopolyspora elongata]